MVVFVSSMSKFLDFIAAFSIVLEPQVGHFIEDPASHSMSVFQLHTVEHTWFKSIKVLTPGSYNVHSLLL